MRRLEGGERERHLRAMEDATSSPGRTRAASSGTMDPARSDHGQTPKGKDAALARRKARGVTLHAQGPAIRARPGATHSRTDPGQPGSCALWRAIPLACEGDGMRATPWPRAANRGRFLLTQDDSL